MRRSEGARARANVAMMGDAEPLLDDTRHIHNLQYLLEVQSKSHQKAPSYGPVDPLPPRLHTKAHDARQPYTRASQQSWQPGESDMAGGPGVRSCHHLSDRNLVSHLFDRAEGVRGEGAKQNPSAAWPVSCRRHSLSAKYGKTGRPRPLEIQPQDAGPSWRMRARKCPLRESAIPWAFISAVLLRQADEQCLADTSPSACCRCSIVEDYFLV